MIRGGIFRMVQGINVCCDQACLVICFLWLLCLELHIRSIASRSRSDGVTVQLVSILHRNQSFARETWQTTFTFSCESWIIRAFQIMPDLTVTVTSRTTVMVTVMVTITVNEYQLGKKLSATVTRLVNPCTT